MARQKITLRELAARADYRYDVIRRRVAGEYPFDTDQLEAVAIALGVPLSQLLGTTSTETAA